MKKNSLRTTLILSLLLHVLAGGILWNLKASLSKPFALNHQSEVELLNPDELLKRLNKPPAPLGQIVDQNEKAVNDQIPKDAKYLSRHNQTVERETKAALTGKFQNAQTMGGIARPPSTPGAKTPPTPQTKEPMQAHHAKPVKTQKLAESATGEKMLPSLDALKPRFNQYQPPSPNETGGTGDGAQASATDDHLKNIPVGMQTMLSTREFVYFSYYNRIKDKLRQYWEPKIKEKVERILREGRTIASSADKTTKIVILLDKNGTLVRVQVVGASGMTDLDDAAVEAFRAAAPFPNPPKGIVEADGMIHIRWDFILEA